MRSTTRCRANFIAGNFAHLHQGLCSSSAPHCLECSATLNSVHTISLHYARFTLADPMPLIVPRCCRRRIGEYASDACLARVAPGHHSPWPTRPRIVGRSGSGVMFIMTPFPVYIFESRRTCFVQHLQIQSFTHTLLFVFLFLCSSSSS